MRIRPTLGTTFINEGSRIDYSEDNPYQIDVSRRFYLFDVAPVSKPRMTQSDKWKTNPEHPDINKRQRPSVTRYWAYKNVLKTQAKEMNFEMKPILDVLFLLPMPNSWSNKKKELHNGLPVTVKPDTDNLIKAIKDIFCENDSHIWRDIGEKRWAFKGSVIVFQ
jgi:Holliday junction resolvase RusA-like endonuclease